MISNKLQNLSDDIIARYASGLASWVERDTVADAAITVADLWLLGTLTDKTHQDNTPVTPLDTDEITTHTRCNIHTLSSRHHSPDAPGSCDRAG